VKVQNDYAETLSSTKAYPTLTCIPTIDGSIWKNQDGKLVIPPDDNIRREIMKEWHDAPTAGHPGRDEMVRLVNHYYYWPGAKHWIAEYVKGCAICQQNKTLTHRIKVPMYRIGTKEDAQPFEHVAMDLITGLPPRGKNNAILTIVDHGCSRAAVFLPCSDTITGPGIAQLYFDNVYRWFGLPSKVISDRDPRFTSHFGKALTAKLGIRQNLSTAFHPQTDGLSEWKNQWVKQYLRLVTSASPEDWTEWLTVATTVHNNRQNATTKLSPNQILLGYDIRLSPATIGESNNGLAEKRLQTMLERRQQAIEALNRTAAQIPTAGQLYKQGDQVWLEATNLRFPHQKTKLLPKCYGPFKVTKEISPVAFRLELPASWNIHNVFHASLLSPYTETAAHGPNFSRPPPDLIDGEEEYEVEQLVAHRYHGRSKALQYLVKWKGYPASDNTWEPADQIHAPDLLKTYYRRNPLTSIKATLVQRSEQLDYPPHRPPLLSSACTSPSLSNPVVAILAPTAHIGPTTPSSEPSTHKRTPHTSTSAPCVSSGSPPALPSGATSTTPTNSVTRPLVASAPKPCLIALPASTHVTFAPRPPSVKLPSLSISPHTYPLTNDPIPVQHANESSLTNTICVSTSTLTTPGESRNTSASTATSDQIGNRIWPVIPSSCTTAQASMHKSPATCQSRSPGGLLSLFLKHTHSPHTLRTRTFNLVVG
jgi:hypothetical protein